MGRAVPILLAALLLTADPFATRQISAINAYRLDEGLSALTASDQLSQAADLHCQWIAFASKRKLAWQHHATDSSWLRLAHPDLLWDRLDATFPCGIPSSISSFDLARLCGYAGLVRDISAVGDARAPVNVIGWDRSPTHRTILRGDWSECGVGKRGIGNGNSITAAFFGE